MFSNPREYNEILQYITLFLLFIIAFMIYYINTNTDNLKDDIHNLKLECPPCPENPSCAKCPDLKCGDNPVDIPECPECDKCPTVDDIVSGIFPGRNTGITSGGKYFDVKAEDSFDLLPDYDYYNPVEAFPEDSILSQSVNYKKENTPNIDNTIDNENMNTSKDTPMVDSSNPSLGNPSLSSLDRMNMGLTDTSIQSISGTGDTTSRPNGATRSKE